MVTITTDDSANSPAPECIALVKWRNCISHSVTISQLAVCLNQLEKCIAWEKSPMKVVRDNILSSIQIVSNNIQ